MFGVTFAGHPDLRRILMWETTPRAIPLRKDFPLRGHFSRVRADPAGARRQPRGALLAGRAVDRRGVRGLPRRHARAAAAQGKRGFVE